MKPAGVQTIVGLHGSAGSWLSGAANIAVMDFAAAWLKWQCRAEFEQSGAQGVWVLVLCTGHWVFCPKTERASACCWQTGKETAALSLFPHSGGLLLFVTFCKGPSGSVADFSKMSFTKCLLKKGQSSLKVGLLKMCPAEKAHK